VIVVPGPLDAPAERLVRALGARGGGLHRPGDPPPAGPDPATIIVSTGAFVFDLAAIAAGLAPRSLRLLVLSRLGAHPDARADGLKRLWRLEEHARRSGAPVLTLRLAPVVGPGTPLWDRLRSRPALPRGGRQLLNPVLERDVLETLARALDGRSAWNGWYEVAGPEVWSLAELRELAAAQGRAATAGAWEPPLEELAEHRLAESGPWCAHFGIAPGRLEDGVRGVAA
jgi:uncharacterized protein YbjT (DUF2867 family)